MELKGFKKLNESTSPELLSPEELTISENLVLDEEIGRPKKRFGWQRFNSNPTAGTISSLHEVVTSDGTNYLLTGHSGKLQKSEDGTDIWSDVTSKGTPPYKMQPYADRFIFTDGNVVPFLVSGDALETVVDLEIEAPDVTGITTGYTTGGSLTTNSFYKWIFIYSTETGEVSPPSNPITHRRNVVPPYSVSGTDQTIGFKDIPVSLDPRVTHRQIYRTLANGEVYYFHSQIDNIATTWFDDKPDEDLGSEEFNFLSVPSTAEYISLHKERIILGNLTRIVKSFMPPEYTNVALADFDADNGYEVKTITGSISDSLGINNSYASGVGTLVAGDYKYRLTYIDTEGLESDYIETNTITVNGSETAVISMLPFMDNDYNAIVRCNIYRAKDTFTDANFKLIRSYDPRFYDIAFGFMAFFVFNDDGTYADGDTYTVPTTDAEKCGIAFSEIGQPSVYRLEDIRNIFPDDGDQITGVFDDLDGIVVFKEKSINKIYTNGAPDNWRLVKLLPNIGCDEPNSLIKYGNTYAFSFQDSIYTWNSQGGLKEIGIEIWDSLSQVTAYHSATADSGWYMFGVSGGGLTSGYGFLVYDYNLETWYKFTTTTAPYTAKIKENANDIGTILTTSGTYILWYSEAVVDGDTGSDVDIVAKLRTKTFGEAISLLRLRKLKFNYKKLDGESITITIVNPDTAVTNTYTDSTDATIDDGWKLYESPVKATDSLKETSKFYVNIEGAGLTEFGSLRVEGKPILKGKRDLNAN